MVLLQFTQKVSVRSKDLNRYEIVTELCTRNRPGSRCTLLRCEAFFTKRAPYAEVISVVRLCVTLSRGLSSWTDFLKICHRRLC
jgi:hypothetical protein